MENNLFRKNSLEKISSPEQLNEYIKITSPSIWSILVGCLALFIMIGVWGVYGNIPDTVKTKGVIFPQNGVTKVIPVGTGRISDMRVSVGDHVEAGQILAVIPQTSIIESIEELKDSEAYTEEQMSEMQSEYERLSLIKSPVSGIVLSAKNTYDNVFANESIANIVEIEKNSNSKELLCYIDATLAKKLREGMEIQVSPDFAPREEYGYMLGNITSIGEYPVTQEDILSSLGTMQYAEGIIPQENSVEVRITLSIDPDSKNNIKWSNEKGEALPLTLGTNCDILIILDNKKPYELIIK